MAMNWWSRFAPALSVFLAVGLMAGPASAQIGRSGAPIEITSNQTEYRQSEGRGVYTGNVVATQGDSRMTADTLTFLCTRNEPAAGESATCQEIEQLIAEGQVLYTAPEVKIRGDRAQYDAASDTITITGDVILSRGAEGVVRGTQVVYKVSDGRSVITAGKSRVTTILVPKSKQPPAAPSAPAPAPRPN